MDALQILFWPFVACLILTGIHAYLGLHVVERGVIFVDLSLAQVAALGSTCAILAGFDLHARAAYFFSLGFTLLGAAVFALTRSKKSKIPQEAFIGITYAVSAAASILIMDRLPEGGEHIKHILVGNLLAVDKTEILKMLGIYSAVGLLHWTWRKPLLTISTDHDNDSGHPYSVRLWDFVFYATFGFVVTSSVAIAGVLLVFSFLIVPPVTAMLFSQKIGVRLAFGWIMGAVVSLLGIYGSYRWDTPTGATVVCMFGAALLVLAGARPLFRRPHQNRTIPAIEDRPSSPSATTGRSSH
jgi:zinc/manganese transport system permease protein